MKRFTYSVTFTGLVEFDAADVDEALGKLVEFKRSTRLHPISYSNLIRDLRASNEPSVFYSVQNIPKLSKRPVK